MFDKIFNSKLGRKLGLNNVKRDMEPYPTASVIRIPNPVMIDTHYPPDILPPLSTDHMKGYYTGMRTYTRKSAGM